jgi:phage terminase large subunit-like protein
MKATELSDYSVGTVWGVKGDLYYLLDLIRADSGPSRTVIPTHRGQRSGDCGQLLMSV